MNKSETIRRYIAKHPEAKATEILAALQKSGSKSSSGWRKKGSCIYSFTRSSAKLADRSLYVLAILGRSEAGIPMASHIGSHILW